MSLLERVREPQDLKRMSRRQVSRLAEEIRAFLIKHVSRTGGHLGPNLGVVELTIALHRVFSSPDDPIIFDTGHQSYVHKILTGRSAEFATLRQRDGLSGYPSRDESVHDWVENSHASTALSWAAGLARANQMKGSNRTVVAVIGDGALTGGMAWEALNNIAVSDDMRLVIVVNDNGRSYTPTVGGLASHLNAMRTDRRYERTMQVIRDGVRATPVVGRPLYELMHGFKTGVKDVLAPQGLFADLGLKYVGPVDGHDLTMMERALEAARNYGGPVIVHAITAKGKGFRAAEENEQDRFHAVGKIDEITGVPLADSQRRTWTDAFSDHIVGLAAAHPEVVAITAAMLHPTGLGAMQERFPDRVFDVGIAEQHAVTFAAGLARGGFHPVVAVYATFLNRAFDQVLMDVALHKLGVTLVLDRAGVTGPDGASHNGMWDLALMGMVPGLHLAAPRDEQRLAEALATSVTMTDAPSVIRFSKEALPAPISSVAQHGSVDVLINPDDARVLLVAYGQFASLAMQVADRLAVQGISVRVVDPVWAVPISDDLVSLCSEHDCVVTLEDCGVVGGLGTQLAQQLAAHNIVVPVRPLGIAQEFLAQASRKEILAEQGLTPDGIAATIADFVAAVNAASEVAE